MTAAAVTSAGDTTGGNPLIIQLASCDAKLRNKSLKTLLLNWLPSQTSVSEEEMRKIWKGLFYAMWHSDKALAQVQLIGRLSDMMSRLGLGLAVVYFEVFLVTVMREWTGIDNLRLDKFYLLIRRFINSLFTMLKKNYYWDLDIVTRFMTVLEVKAFFSDDKCLSNGVNYHITSVFLEELTGFLSLKVEIVEVLFKPFISVMAKSQDKVLVCKAKSSLFDVLLKMGRSLIDSKKSSEDNVVDDKVTSLGAIGLKMGFSGKFYDLGTSSDCLQGNRKVLLKLHEDFLRLEKDLESSGIEVTIPDPTVDDEEVVPELIPISGEIKQNGIQVNGNGSGRHLKKNKKAKKGDEVDKGSKKANKKKKKKDKDLASENGDSTKKESNENESEKKKDRDVVTSNGDDTNKESNENESELIFTESVISNLQKQFEKVAAEIDAKSGESHETAIVADRASKKRKRAKSVDVEVKNSIPAEEETNIGEKSEKSAKKVRFSMKSNLVWKPHSPMPPQSLRIPPSVTPRGSALKKGVPPGPVREIPTAAKKAKLKMKKARRVSKISPAVKRLRKIQAITL